MAGNLYRALGRDMDARDAFGWSARAVAFRAASYVRLSEVMVGVGRWGEAKRYAELALDFDRESVPAWQLLAIAGRLSGDREGAERALAALLDIDPLHHFVLAERHLAEPADASADALLGALRSEYPGQTLLEMAVRYAGLGLRDDALSVLQLAGAGSGESPSESGDPQSGSPGPRAGSDDLRRGRDGPVLRAWRAFLGGDPTGLEDPGDLDFAFPFRPETLPVLRWATEESDHWGWRYLLGLNLWALERKDEAVQVLASLGGVADYGPAYAALGRLVRERGGDPGLVFQRAVEYDPDSRILWVEEIRYLQEEARWPGALQASARAREIFPGDFNLDLLHARALIHLGGYDEAIAILADTHVLPSENARESHFLYKHAHVGAALDDLEAGELEAARTHLEAALLWPESLGQGRPYSPDERLVRFLFGVAAWEAGDRDGALEQFRTVVATIAGRTDLPRDIGDILAIEASRVLGLDPGLELRDAVAEFMSDPPEGFGRGHQALRWRFTTRALELAATLPRISRR